MSHQQENMSDEKQGKVEINDLPEKEAELTEAEAKDVKGGGGAMGGVVMRKPSGEELPQ